MSELSGLFENIPHDPGTILNTVDPRGDGARAWPEANLVDVISLPLPPITTHLRRTGSAPMEDAPLRSLPEESTLMKGLTAGEHSLVDELVRGGTPVATAVEMVAYDRLG